MVKLTKIHKGSHHFKGILGVNSLFSTCHGAMLASIFGRRKSAARRSAIRTPAAVEADPAAKRSARGARWLTTLMWP